MIVRWSRRKRLATGTSWPPCRGFVSRNEGSAKLAIVLQAKRDFPLLFAPELGVLVSIFRSYSPSLL